MKCLETRRRGGIKWRRYRTEEGAIVRTGEVPIEVLSHLGAARLKEALEKSQRRIDKLKRRAKAENLLRQGWKPTAIAEALGVSEQTVREYRKHLKD